MKSFGVHLIFVICALVTTSTIGWAQSSADQKSKDVVVGLTVDSNFARVADSLPRLRESLVKSLSQKRKQVRVVALDGPPEVAEDAAKGNACGYLLEMHVVEMTGAGAGVEYGSRVPNHVSAPGEELERRELGWLRIDYRLRSLDESGFNMNDMDYVRSLDFPTAWDASAFDTTVFRTISRVASTGLSKLPKK